MTDYFPRNGIRPGVDTTGIYVGRAVRGSTFADLGRLHNWLIGDGYAVVPTNFYNLSLLTDLYLFTWRVWPRKQTIHRRWKFTFASADVGETVVIKVPSSGSANTFILPNGPVYVDEYLSSQSDSEQTIDCSIEPTTATVTLIGIESWAVPRTRLVEGGTEYGIDPGVFLPGGGVYRQDRALRYIDNAQGDSFEIGRRCSLTQWALPDHVNGATSTTNVHSTTSATAVDLFEVAIPVLTRRLSPTDINSFTHATTGTLKARIKAWKGGAGSPTIWIKTNSAGSTAAQTVSTGVPRYYPTTNANAFSITAHCEDLESADGRQTAASPAWDTVIARGIGVGGGTTLYVSGVSIWQDE